MGTKLGNTFKHFLAMREGVLILVIILVFVLMSFVSPYFLTSQTMLNLLISFTIEGIIAVGMVLVLISGGMDLSAGANMGLCGVIAAMCYVNGLPLGTAVLIGLACGLGIGIANGFLISYVGLNPFICTLGMQMSLDGLMKIISVGRAVPVSGAFAILGAGKLLGVQLPVWILLGIAVFIEILLRKSRVFRQSYYVGGNENAARLNGINVRKIKLSNYAITGLLAGLTGILLASRFETASITVGGDTALKVLTACIIGGASLSGGEGSVSGAILGVVFIQLLSSSFNIMDVNTFIKTFITGLILVAAITIDVLNEKRKNTRIIAENQKNIEEV